MSQPVEDSPEWGERTAADLSSLLVELGRVLRGIGFYSEDDTARGELLGRAYLALQGELDRAGPLELWIAEEHFRASEIDEPIAHGRLADLAEAFSGHGIERVTFDAKLTRDALSAFVELLEQTPKSLHRAGGMARALAARSSAGIRINGGEENAIAGDERLIRTPALPTASLGSALLAQSHGLVVNSARTDGRKPDLSEKPLEAAPGDERGERLLFRLIELDRCTDDVAYEFLGKRIVDWAKDLFAGGLVDECHRTILVLADHAVGEGGRSGLQARIAHRLCVDLASQERLDALIDRAQSPDVRASIRATQVLLQLGKSATPPIIDRLAETQDEEASAQLTAILITLGETALPDLRCMISGPSTARALLALRLAGELQNQEIVPVLVQVLTDPQVDMRREAARSLAHLGGEAATDALINALSSDLEEMPETAAHCLSAMQERRATQPLLAALDRALRRGDARRAREMIRGLGQLGEERAVPKLVALLERRTLIRRRWLRELQLAAVAALDKLPGREAYRAVERAGRHRESAVRKRAEKLAVAKTRDGAKQ
jgi:HEAT repeat protein